MIKVNSETDKVCVAKVCEAGQDHVFQHWESLTSDEQRVLIADLGEIDFQLLKRLVQQTIHAGDAPTDERVLKPVPMEVPPAAEDEPEERELCRTLGEYALRKGQVAFVTAAGTGGADPTEEPLGLLPVGPVTGKSVFQLQAEKIRALNRRYKTSLRWYIFCHPLQHETTAAFFKDNSYFGLNCSDIQFFTEDLLPVVDRRGRLILAEPWRTAKSTVGQGGIVMHFLQEETLKSLERGGIDHLFYFQVDNPLVNVGDPVFLGLHIKKRSEISSKAIRRQADDDLAVFCLSNNYVGVALPSELTEEELELQNSDGDSAFDAGQIGVHLFSVEFLRRLAESKPQMAFRGVPHSTAAINKRGQTVRPASPNSIRFQSLLLDVVQGSKAVTIVEVDRAEEYSPIRNMSGAASPQTAQRDLSHLYTRWLRQACAELKQSNKSSSIDPAVEISPLYAMDAEELKEKIELPLCTSNGDILLSGRGG